MTMKVEKQVQRTSSVAPTRQEEGPILSEDERLEMIASLKAAEARIAQGQYVEHDADTFVDRLMDIRAEAIRNRKA